MTRSRSRRVRVIALLLAIFFMLITVLGVDMVAGRPFINTLYQRSGFEDLMG